MFFLTFLLYYYFSSLIMNKWIISPYLTFPTSPSNLNSQIRTVCSLKLGPYCSTLRLLVVTTLVLISMCSSHLQWFIFNDFICNGYSCNESLVLIANIYINETNNLISFDFQNNVLRASIFIINCLTYTLF